MSTGNFLLHLVGSPKKERKTPLKLNSLGNFANSDLVFLLGRSAASRIFMLSRGDKRALLKRALCSLPDFWP